MARAVAGLGALLYTQGGFAGFRKAPDGHVAEWLRNGLQNRVHQFNSGRGLHSRFARETLQTNPATKP